MTRRVTRRRALADALAGAGIGLAAVGIAGCGGRSGMAASMTGSTLDATWGDPIGDGQLRVGPGEPLADRIELGPRAAVSGVIATLAHVTDAHVLDAASPARVTFLARLGAPFESTFRPQETLTAHVLAGAVEAIRAMRPDVVIQGGDLIDNAQNNELVQALGVLSGGLVRPGSGPNGYYGVQSPFNPDPFYYRPDVDAPRHPGLLRAAARPFSAGGLRAAFVPVLGDHDALVAGELVPTAVTASLAVGDRALWDLPDGVAPPPGVPLTTGLNGSPDGPPEPILVDRLLTAALRGSTVRVPADAGRREMSFDEVISRLRGSARFGSNGLRPSPPDLGAPSPALDYVVDVGSQLRLIVLDLVRRDGGSGGVVPPGQAGWLANQLAGAGSRWVIVVSHHPLISSQGGEALLALLDREPRVIATLAGHIHRNEILPRHAPGGGYWQITTSSLIDYPQQTRALRVVATEGGGVAIETWMLDHVFPGPLGAISRELSFIDAHGGRPKRFSGGRLDRNVTLFRGPPKPIP